jgi:cation/acetate symporter
MARLNLIETVNQPDGTQLVYAERPTWIKKWEETGLLAFEDKNGDGEKTRTATVKSFTPPIRK